MKLNKKSIISIILSAICAITFIFSSFSGVEAKAATNEVSLYYMDRQGIYHACARYNIYIKVLNKAYDKDVTVHYTLGELNGVWEDAKATYVASLDNNYDIFKVELGGFGGLEYAIKYTVNGQTYWDNNNGNNYTGSDNLGTAPMCVLRPDYNTLSVKLNNYGYSKKVTVHYTNDNWATTQTKDLSYSSTNDNGIEYWSTDFTRTSDTQYYITYTVNGQTYIDNNWGNNYNSSFINNY